ncbi:MAG: 3-dehydroquinate synthase [Chloroflexota bacterium]|nr:3-dehydroquinate synthase [Chloroflexota bacterium]
MDKKGNIIIIGFSFTGKSVVGERVAQRLGWELIDSDHTIAAIEGKSVPEIFAEEGEAHFRKLERRVLQKACSGSRKVIVAGGGAIVDPQNRDILSQRGVVICLEAKPKTIYKRLLESTQNEDTVPRPLLNVADPLARIIQIKASRQAYYATADWTVYTDDLDMEQTVDDVIEGYEQVRSRKTGTAKDVFPFIVTTPSESYPVFVGWDILDDLGRRMRQTGLTGGVRLISDDNVFPHHGERAIESLRKEGFETETYIVPAGESTKSIETATKLYDWMVGKRTERGHAVVALGGGMTGDLAGFAAATFLRGLPLVHAPTSLMAMTDSSIGGKVAVNHPQAKNLIGAFYQPRLVLADVSTLTTLPHREFVSGWAEVIKHAMILDADFLGFLESNADALLKIDTSIATEAIRRSAHIKATVVGEDEREQRKRMVLNYGHTIAHGLEAATGYDRLLHGEAVAVGMMGAAFISERLGLIPRDVVLRQRNVLERFGLPTTCSDIDLQAVLEAIALDKKVRERAVQWVLPEGIGRTTFRNDVPQEDALGVIKELVGN